MTMDNGQSAERMSKYPLIEFTFGRGANLKSQQVTFWGWWMFWPSPPHKLTIASNLRPQRNFNDIFETEQTRMSEQTQNIWSNSSQNNSHKNVSKNKTSISLPCCMQRHKPTKDNVMTSYIVPIWRNIWADSRRKLKLDGVVIVLMRPSLDIVMQDGNSNCNKDYLVLVEEVYTMSVSAKQRWGGRRGNTAGATAVST